MNLAQCATDKLEPGQTNTTTVGVRPTKTDVCGGGAEAMQPRPKNTEKSTRKSPGSGTYEEGKTNDIINMKT
jgi:hypothetical protein